MRMSVFVGLAPMGGPACVGDASVVPGVVTFEVRGLRRAGVAVGGGRPPDLERRRSIESAVFPREAYFVTFSFIV